MVYVHAHRYMHAHSLIHMHTQFLCKTVFLLFTCFLSKGDSLTLIELRKQITDYVKTNNLQTEAVGR